MIDVPFIIVEGGAVGISADVCLGRRGVPCVVVERDAWVTNHPESVA